MGPRPHPPQHAYQSCHFKHIPGGEGHRHSAQVGIFYTVLYYQSYNLLLVRFTQVRMFYTRPPFNTRLYSLPPRQVGSPHDRPREAVCRCPALHHHASPPQAWVGCYYITFCLKFTPSQSFYRVLMWLILCLNWRSLNLRSTPRVAQKNSTNICYGIFEMVRASVG